MLILSEHPLNLSDEFALKTNVESTNRFQEDCLVFVTVLVCLLSVFKDRAMAAVKSIKKSAVSPFAKVYLISYNLIQCVGWSMILVRLLLHFSVSQPQKTLWQDVDILVIIFQSAAVLEIVNAFLRLVPSNPFLTLAQVFSRLFLLWGILLSAPVTRTCLGFAPMLICWTITEIIRYGYYTLHLTGGVPAFLLWCRYTLFIVLYPIGVSGELLCCYAALSYVQKTGLYTIYMPNALNYVFDYYLVIIGIMLTYIPGFPKLYLHMFSQRKKFLGSQPDATSKVK